MSAALSGREPGGDADTNCPALIEAVAARDWQQVGQLLHTAVCGQAQRLWAMREASAHASTEQLVQYIVPYALGMDLPFLLDCCVENQQWEVVGHILQQEGVEAEDRRRAVEKAMSRATRDNESAVSRVITQCRDGQLSAVLSDAMARGLWKTFRQLVERLLMDGELVRQVFQESFRRMFDETLEGYTPPTCDDDICDHFFLINCVREGDWEAVYEVLCRLDVCAVETGCTDWNTFLDAAYALSRAAFLDEWETVGPALGQHVHTALYRHAILEASRFARLPVFIRLILPHYFDARADSSLRQAMGRRLWRIVQDLPGGEVRHCWLDSGMAVYGESDADPVLHLSRPEDWQLLKAVVDQDWRVVGGLLQHGVDHAVHRWAVLQACKQASESDLVEHIILRSCEDQWEGMLTQTMARAAWRATQFLLQHAASDSLYTLAIYSSLDGAHSQLGDDIPVLKDYVLPASHEDQQRDFALLVAVTERQWETVSQLLKEGVHECLYKWAVTQTVGLADEDTIVQHFLCYFPVSGGHSMPAASHTWSSGEIHAMLHAVTPLGKWRVLARLLQCSVETDPEQRALAIQKACQRAGEEDIMKYVIPHIQTEQELEAAFCQIEEYQNFSSAVCELLQQGLFVLKAAHWVLSALDRMVNEDTAQGLLSLCSGDQLSVLLSSAVGTGRWAAAAYILQTQVDGEQRRRAADEAMLQASADNEHALSRVVSQCCDDQVNTLCRDAISRRLWGIIRQLAHRVTDRRLLIQAVEDSFCCIFGEPLESYTSPACMVDQRADLCLTDAVRRSRWGEVGELLQAKFDQRPDADTIAQSCQHVDWNGFLHLACLLEEAWRKNTWDVVGHMLDRCAHNALYRQALTEATRYADQTTFICTILPRWFDIRLDTVSTLSLRQRLLQITNCSSDSVADGSLVCRAMEDSHTTLSGDPMTGYQLPIGHTDCQLLKAAVDQDWRVVGVLLQQGVDRAVHKWAMLQAGKQASEGDLVEHIIARSSEDEWEGMLTQTMARSAWRATQFLLQHAASDSLYTLAIHNSLQTTSGTLLRDYELPASRENQFRDFKLTVAVKESDWQTVADLLKDGLHNSLHKWAVEQAIECPDEDTTVAHFFCHFADIYSKSQMPEAVKWDRDQMHDLLTRTTRQHRWRVLGHLLKGISDLDVSTQIDFIRRSIQLASPQDIRQHLQLPDAESDYGSSEED